SRYGVRGSPCFQGVHLIRSCRSSGCLVSTLSWPSVPTVLHVLSVRTQRRRWPVHQYTETPMACPSVHRNAHGLSVSTHRRPQRRPWPARQYTETTRGLSGSTRRRPMACPSVHRNARGLSETICWLSVDDFCWPVDYY